MLTNLPALVSLLTVVREGGVGPAAACLHYSPSTVRMHVRLVEQQLGVRLLNRGDSGALLTTAGQALLPAMVAVVRAVARLEEQARAHSR
jgi:DNA-binding transcriptional LysR family regulator